MRGISLWRGCWSNARKKRLCPEKNKEDGVLKKTQRGLMGYMVLIAAFILIAVILNGGFGQTVDRRIEYPKLLEAIENNQVQAVAIRGSSLVGMYKDSTTAVTDFPERNYDFETTIGSDFIDTVRRITAAKTGKAVEEVSVTDFTFTVQYRAPL